MGIIHYRRAVYYMLFLMLVSSCDKAEISLDVEIENLERSASEETALKLIFENNSDEKITAGRAVGLRFVNESPDIECLFDFYGKLQLEALYSEKIPTFQIEPHESVTKHTSFKNIFCENRSAQMKRNVVQPWKNFLQIIQVVPTGEHYMTASIATGNLNHVPTDKVQQPVFVNSKSFVVTFVSTGHVSNK